MGGGGGQVGAPLFEGLFLILPIDPMYMYVHTCRYLREELLEVQVWATVFSGVALSRPQAEDKLLGCAYLPLSEALLTNSSGGSYPVFKPGVDSLGGLALQAELKKTEMMKEPPSQEENAASLKVLVSCV